MSILVASPPEPRAREIEFIADAFVVYLEDGRSLTVPLEWFPRLRDATPDQRANYELIGPGSASTGPRSTKTSRCPDSSASPAEPRSRSTLLAGI